MPRRLGSALVLSALVVAVLTGCAGTQDRPAAAAAQGFLAAVSGDDGERACSLLAPAARSGLADATGKPCEEAVLDELDGGPPAGTPDSVQVYDSMAQVRLGPETLFLSQFDGEWLVVGAACTPAPGDQPYDCSIQVS